MTVYKSNNKTLDDFTLTVSIFSIEYILNSVHNDDDKKSVANQT